MRHWTVISPAPCRTRPSARDLTAVIVANANPRAYAAEIGPGRPIPQLDRAARDAVIAAADRDFVSGIRAALAVAILLLGVTLAAGYRGFPRDSGN